MWPTLLLLTKTITHLHIGTFFVRNCSLLAARNETTLSAVALLSFHEFPIVLFLRSSPPLRMYICTTPPCHVNYSWSDQETARTRAKPSWGPVARDPRSRVLHRAGSLSVSDMSKECTHVCERWFAYEWALPATLPPRGGAPDPPGQRFQLDRGTSHGNVKHDYSRTDNTCNNNRISRPTAGPKAAGDLVLLMNPWIMVCTCRLLFR